MTFLEAFFNGGYMPHGHCFLWQPGILWVTVISDLIIAISYFSIPILLLIVIHKRKDLKFRGIFILFAAFILLCGITHIFSVYNLWNGAYGIHSILKAATAAASIITAVVLYSNLKIALKFPTLQQLEQSVEQAETLFESAPVAFIVVNKSGIITKANQHADALYRHPSQKLDGAQLEDFVPVAIKDSIISSLLQNIYVDPRAPLKNYHSTMLKRENGEEFQADIKLVPIVMENELHMLMVIHDITQQKALEKTLAEAKETAESHSRSKTHFVANMSHEIRTPLNAILGSAQLIRKTDLNSLQNKYIRMIQESGSALLNIVNNILDFSKIESGKMELVPTADPIYPLLSKISAIMAINIGDKNVELLIDCDSKLPKKLFLDHLRLQQVLINLASNAIKFTDRGYVKLSVQVVGRSENNDYKIRFSVEDTGIGMTHEQQTDLFKAFVQLDTSNTRQYEGTGLGLTISNQIIKTMNSRIQVASNIGKGSEFSFTLDVPGINSLDNSLRLTRSRKVLLMEPFEKSRLILEDILHQLNCEFYSLASWHDGIKQEDFRSFLQDCDAIMMNITHSPSPEECMNTLTKLGFNSNNQAILILNNAQQASNLDKYLIETFSPKMPKPLYAGAVIEALNSFDQNPKPSQYSIEHATSLKGICALIVEDNDLNQVIIENMLADLEVTYKTVANGQEAVYAFRDDPTRFDVILMDIQMPIMDGEQATSIIRQEDQSKIPIIAMTASVLSSEKEKYFALGMNDLVPKPIEEIDLIRALTKIRDNKKIIDHDASESGSTLCIFDSSRVEKLAKNNPARLKKLVESLVSIEASSKQTFTETLEAVQAGNFDQAKFVCHTLKGVVANFGGERLSESIRQLEQKIIAKTSAAEIEGDIKQAQEELKLFVQESQEWAKIQEKRIS